MSVDKNQPCHPTWPYMSIPEKVASAKAEDAESDHPVLHYSPLAFMQRQADLYRIMAMCESLRTKRNCERHEAEVLAWIQENETLLKGLDDLIRRVARKNW